MEASRVAISRTSKCLGLNTHDRAITISNSKLGESLTTKTHWKDEVTKPNRKFTRWLKRTLLESILTRLHLIPAVEAYSIRHILRLASVARFYRAKVEVLDKVSHSSSIRDMVGKTRPKWNSVRWDKSCSEEGRNPDQSERPRPLYMISSRVSTSWALRGNRWSATRPRQARRPLQPSQLKCSRRLTRVNSNLS